MGRFATAAEFYARYREPYTAEFFATVARELHFQKSDTLLDVACGPGLLAIGFAPYLGRVEGLDPEPNMLAAAREAAQQASVPITLHAARLEDFTSPTTFDVITIGRALHWLDHEPSVAALDRLLAPAGVILNCGAFTDPERNPWSKPYDDLRSRYADMERCQYRDSSNRWFDNSPFYQITDIRVPSSQSVTIDELILRSHSKSNTSPAVLGDRRSALENELRTLLTPYAQNGHLEEHIIGIASVFSR